MFWNDCYFLYTYDYCYYEGKYKYKYKYKYRKEEVSVSTMPNGRSISTHNFLMALNDRKNKRKVFTEKTNKKAMSEYESKEYKLKKETKKLIRQEKKEAKEIKNYFGF